MIYTGTTSGSCLKVRLSPSRGLLLLGFYFPIDLYQLTELQFLDVSSNQITRLPPSIRLLASIQTLRVMDNPLELPPSQVSLSSHLAHPHTLTAVSAWSGAHVQVF